MKTHSQGFSLIEVLVTLVLTAVGVLGMFVLQSKSISYTQDTVHQEAAISAANELVEIMRVYRDELFEETPYKLDSFGEFYTELKSNTDLYENGNATFSSTDCPTDRAQTAKGVAGCWLERQQMVLPDFQVDTLCPSVTETGCVTGFNGASLLLAVSWSSRDSSCGEESNSDTCAYSVRVEL